MICACGRTDHKGELILGDWDLAEAIRQGKPTTTLDGLRFTFTNDSVYTNSTLFGNQLYSYSNDTITILDVDPFLFHVFYVDSTHLDLHVEIKQVPFRLKFEKIQP